MQTKNIFAFELCSFIKDTFKQADSSEDTKKAQFLKFVIFKLMNESFYIGKYFHLLKVFISEV